MRHTIYTLFSNKKTSPKEYKDIIKDLGSNRKYSVLETSSVDEINKGIQNQNSGIVLFAITTFEELSELVQICKSNTTAIKIGVLKIAGYNFTKSTKVDDILHKMKISDVLDENITSKGLIFKINYWIRAIESNLRKHELFPKDKSIFDVHFQSKKEIKEEKIKKNECVFISPIDFSSDCWIINKNVKFRFAMGNWIMEFYGPGTYAGRWTEYKNEDDSEWLYWRWIPLHIEQFPFITDDGFWLFRGAQPQFMWKTNTWKFMSPFPLFQFKFNKSKKKPITKVRTKNQPDGSQKVLVTKDSKSVLAKRNLLLESADPKIIQKTGEMNIFDGETRIESRSLDEKAGDKKQSSAKKNNEEAEDETDTPYYKKRKKAEPQFDEDLYQYKKESKSYGESEEDIYARKKTKTLSEITEDIYKKKEHPLGEDNESWEDLYDLREKIHELDDIANLADNLYEKKRKETKEEFDEDLYQRKKKPQADDDDLENLYEKKKKESPEEFDEDLYQRKKKPQADDDDDSENLYDKKKKESPEEFDEDLYQRKKKPQADDDDLENLYDKKKKESPEEFDEDLYQRKKKSQADDDDDSENLYEKKKKESPEEFDEDLYQRKKKPQADDDDLENLYEKKKKESPEEFDEDLYQRKKKPQADDDDLENLYNKKKKNLPEEFDEDLYQKRKDDQIDDVSMEDLYKKENKLSSGDYTLENLYDFKKRKNKQQDSDENIYKRKTTSQDTQGLGAEEKDITEQLDGPISGVNKWEEANFGMGKISFAKLQIDLTMQIVDVDNSKTDVTLMDIIENLIVVTSPLNQFQAEMNIVCDINCKYAYSNLHLTVQGKITEITEIDENSAVCTVELQNYDQEQLEQLQSYFQKRQDNINVYLKTSRGY